MLLGGCLGLQGLGRPRRGGRSRRGLLIHAVEVVHEVPEQDEERRRPLVEVPDASRGAKALGEVELQGSTLWRRGGGSQPSDQARRMRSTVDRGFRAWRSDHRIEVASPEPGEPGPACRSHGRYPLSRRRPPDSRVSGALEGSGPVAGGVRGPDVLRQRLEPGGRLIFCLVDHGLQLLDDRGACVQKLPAKG